MTSQFPSASARLLAGLLTATGSLHFLAPAPFVRIVPRRLPTPYGLVYASGVAELACAVGLAVPRTRRLAGGAAALLFVALFPANVQMALDARCRRREYRWATYARLPLQAPLILWAADIARTDRPGHSA